MPRPKPSSRASLRLAVALPLLLLLGASLAGCSEGGMEPGDEVVVKSAPLVEVKSPDGSSQTASQAVLPPSTKYGHLAGVVVDSSITPIEGAVVSIPGLDLSDETQRGGSFSFTDLVAGQYFVRAEAPGFATAESVVEVAADQFARVKFVLERLPPPTPKVVTQEFKAFMDYTSADIVLFTGCNGCDIDFYVQEPGLQAVVIDAVMDPYGGVGAGTVGSNGFYYQLGESGGSCCDYIREGDMGNPGQIRIQGNETAELPDPLHLSITATSFPAPEVSKPFTVYITSWVNATPPPGWKFGDPVPA